MKGKRHSNVISVITALRESQDWICIFVIGHGLLKIEYLRIGMVINLHKNQSSKSCWCCNVVYFKSEAEKMDIKD